MARIEIQKTMLVDGKEVHVSERAPVTDASQLTGGGIKALTETLSWSIGGQFHILDAEGSLVLEPKLEFF